MSVAQPVIDYIDGPARLIYLKSGVTSWHPVEDIYPEVRQLRQDNEALRSFDMFVEAIPIIEKQPGVYTGRALVLRLGTRIVPFDEPILQSITGELLSDAGLSGSVLVETATLANHVRINYEPKPGQETVTVEVPGDGLSAADKAQLAAIQANQERLMKVYGMVPGSVYRMPPSAGGPVLEDGQPIADVSGDCDTGFTVTGRP